MTLAAQVTSTLQRWFNQEDLCPPSPAATYARKAMERMPVSAWAAAWRALAEHGPADRLRAVTAPGLCLAGENDPSTPPQLVEAIAELILGAEFEVIAGAPHLLTLTHPNIVAERLLTLSTRVTKGLATPPQA